MAKNKLKKFRINETRDNIIQEGKPLFSKLRGNWKPLYFSQNHPITLELGCGGGEYTVGLAAHYPDRNFIGVDIKGARLFTGSTLALENGLHNVGFLRIRIDQLTDFFAPGEISEIWLTFPDPQLKDSREKHRLTHPRFLELYRKVLAPGGMIHLKTDSRPLFDYTFDVLSGQQVKDLRYTFDLYAENELLDIHKGIQTKYEKMFLEKGLKINYLQFTF